MPGHAPRERVSWNWVFAEHWHRRGSHAPRERVSWNCLSDVARAFHESRSTWACELKWQHKAHSWLIVKSRSTWACELKFNVRWNYVIISMSRSTWACELKYGCLCHAQSFCGHAPRERVSWNSAVEVCNSAAAGHAPRERVSWNRPWWHLWRPIRVTLHVSVWVEIHH